MMDGKYDVIFRGQIVKSFEMAVVQDNLVKLFKSSPEAVERLFGGKEVTIRKNLDYASAMKYQSALKQSGALALINQVVDSPVEEIATAESSAQPAAQETVSPQSEVEVQSSNENNENLSIAEIGAQILPEKVYQQRDVDTSELSLATVGVRILPERTPENHPQPSIEHLSLDKN